MCGVIPTQMLCVLHWVCGLCPAPWLTARTHTGGSLNQHIVLELCLKMFIVCSASECQATPLDPGNLEGHKDESDTVPTSKSLWLHRGDRGTRINTKVGRRGGWDWKTSPTRVLGERRWNNSIPLQGSGKKLGRKWDLRWFLENK